MIKIIYNKDKHHYNPTTKTMNISEREVKFATSYQLVDVKGNSKIFHFDHSTGPEFDPNTEWVYLCENSEITLVISSYTLLTQAAGKAYLQAKLAK